METVAKDDRLHVLSDYRPAALTSVAMSSFVRLVNAEIPTNTELLLDVFLSFFFTRG